MRALLEDEAEAAAQFMSVEGDAEMFKEEENDEEFETKGARACCDEGKRGRADVEDVRRVRARRGEG